MNMKTDLKQELNEFMSSQSELIRQDVVRQILDWLSGKKIILYGAGACGSTLKRALEINDLSVHCFVDRKADEIGSLGTVPVYLPDRLAMANSSNCVVILCISSHVILEYEKELEENLSKFCPEANAVTEGRKLAYVLLHQTCMDKLDAGKPFDVTECINCGAEDRGCDIFDAFLRRRCSAGTSQEGGNRKFEHFFGYILGKKCTLRCKYCNEMVPYQPIKDFVDKEIVIQDFRKLIDSCTFLPFMELVGGEPFLHPQLKEILEALLEIKNLGYIKIFTNGTVVPDDAVCRLLQNDRVALNFSNYSGAVDEHLDARIRATREKLDAFGIPYICSCAKTWLSFTFKEQQRTEEELTRNFRQCSASDCHRLYKGTLYHCHHQYAGIQLGVLSEHEGETIHLDAYDTKGLTAACDAFEATAYIDACRYCNWPFDAEEVPAAEQATSNEIP